MTHMNREPMEVHPRGEQITPHKNVAVKTEPLDLEYLEENAEEKTADLLIKQAISAALETRETFPSEGKDNSTFDSSSLKFRIDEASTKDLKVEHMKYETLKPDDVCDDDEGLCICNSATDAIKEEAEDSSSISDDVRTEGRLQESRITESSDMYSSSDSYSASSCHLSLQKHRERHHNDDYTCICQPANEISTQRNVQLHSTNTVCHISHMHTGNRNKCNNDQMKIDKCQLSKVSLHDKIGKNYLPQNYKTITESSKFGCEVCGKKCISNVELQSHKRFHTGQIPFQCNICGKSFTQNCNLQMHKRIHTGEKPFTCLECGAAFNRNSNLQKHKKIHTGEKPYSCTECGAAFGESDKLQRHKRIHTGQKPFTCDICGKAYTRRSHLETHKRIHTGETPYSCDVCEKKFSDKSHCSWHKKSKHKTQQSQDETAS